MKYKFKYWIMLKPFIKKYLRQHFDNDTTKIIFRNAKNEYKILINKAEDIGSNNPMAANLYLSLLFLSFFTSNRDLLTEDMLSDMMKSTIENPTIQRFKKMDFNKEEDLEKHKASMLKKCNWAQEHKHSYPNTWVFNFNDDHRDGCSYIFTKCPIAQFFKDNDLEDITHIFCDLDHIIVNAWHGKLIRNHTLAKGDGECDFWIVGDRVQNPK